MFYYNQYVRAQSLDEAYELYQKKPEFCAGRHALAQNEKLRRLARQLTCATSGLTKLMRMRTSLESVRMQHSGR